MSKIALFRTKSFQFLSIIALVVGVGIAFALDTDNDGMADSYENFFKLNPTNAADAVENHDADTLDNLAESALWTNPNQADTDADGWNDDSDDNPLSRAVMWWGDPDFTSGDEYHYTGPEWWLGAGRISGSWLADGGWQVGTNEEGLLYIDIDRSIVTNNLMLNLLHVNATNSLVYLDLADTNDTRVAVDLFGDLTTDNGEKVLSRYILPLADYPSASRILIDASAGSVPYTVWVGTLYEDKDADGLDADQEKQLGTSDNAPDTDGDGCGDYNEAMVMGTSPANVDTDGDGYSDFVEMGDSIFKVVAFDKKISWKDARRDAEKRGGHLATITSEDEHKRLVACVGAQVFGERDLWIGATDEDTDVWRWITGEPFEYTRWEGANPDNYNGKESFAGYWRKAWDPAYPGFQWNDFSEWQCTAYLLELSGRLDPLNPDTDGDGILDGDEVALNCNPYLPDTDDDGLVDGAELAGGTDPANPDTDGDALKDGAELAWGTDPFNPDCDGDGVPDGGETGPSAFAVVVMDENTLWSAAKEDAVRHGGYLATITSEEEHMRLVACVGTNVFAGHDIWIGATDLQSEGAWRWVTGEPFDYTRWEGGNPDNTKGQEHFAGYWHKPWDMKYAGRQWNDFAAWRCDAYFLELEGRLDPLNPDVDGDGLSDGTELALACNPFRVDSDGDGLNDADEVADGTDPSRADTDGDGLADNEEYTVGTDPVKADTDNDGLSDYFELYGYAYQIYTRPDTVSWEDAADAAGIAGGHLACITSMEEHERMLGLVDASLFHQRHVWIGATDKARAGSWSWITGEPFDFSLWAKVTGYAPEPNNATGNEHYAAYGNMFWDVAYSNVAWVDLSDDRVSAFLVERSTAYDPLNPDMDGDGLSDGEENAMGSNPLSLDSDGDGIGDAEEVAMGINPARIDSDKDGLSDPEELNVLGTDPAKWDTDGDGLPDGDEVNMIGTDPLDTDSDDDGIPDMTVARSRTGADCLSYRNLHKESQWTFEGDVITLSALPHYVSDSSSVTYGLGVTEPGYYRLTVDVSWPTNTPPLEKQAVIAFNIDGIGIAKVKPLPNSEGGSVYAVYTPWMVTGEHLIECVALPRGWTRTDGFSVLKVSLNAIDGPDSDGDGISDWSETRLAELTDTDGDGLSDYDEVFLHGTDPLDADTDNDGLNDNAELDAGTDPLNADSDNDGIVDGVEVHESLTNPLVAEFDGTITVVETVPGSATNATVGEWEIQGSELVSKKVRGSVEYIMNFPTNDLYRLNIKAAHSWNKSSCSPVQPQDTSAFLVYVDEVYVGKFPLVSAEGIYVDVGAFLPVMPAGEHTVKLFWENVHKRLSVNIQSLELQSLGGPDNNGNGTKDWIEASVSAMAGVDFSVPQASRLPRIESCISPACIEGNARYPELASLEIQSEIGNQKSAIARGAGPRWYANLPLEQDGTTTATATFQNGALEVPVSIDWVPYNLMEHDGETLYVRKGDRIKFVALPDEAHGGQFEIEYTLGMDGETVRSPNTRPLIYLFPSAGTYTVTGEYTHGNDTVSASIQVVALEGSFPEESPACLVGKQRTWSFAGMPSNVVYEVDDTVELVVEATASSLSGTEALTNQPSLVTEVSLKANDTNGKHVMLARLYENGPVLASTELQPFWIQNAVDGYFWTVERYEDSELWEVQSVAKNVPDSVDIQIKVIVGGVTFDDYTLERWITNAAYDDIGEYSFRLYHPNESDSSTCHTFKLYQGGVFIGDAFSGQEDGVEE